MTIPTIYQKVRKYKLDGLWWEKRRCFSHTWASAWNGNWSGTPSDSNRKRYEYKLCHHMALREFNGREIVTVIHAWWARHGLEPHYHRLLTVTIPHVRRFTSATVAAARADRNKAKRLRRHKRRKQANTRELIVAHLWDNAFRSVAELAARVGINRAAAKKQLQRLTKEGLLLKTVAGYEVAK